MHIVPVRSRGYSLEANLFSRDLVDILDDVTLFQHLR